MSDREKSKSEGSAGPHTDDDEQPNPNIAKLPSLSNKLALVLLKIWLKEYQFKLNIPYINKFFSRGKKGIYIPKECDVCKAPLMLIPHNAVCATQDPLQAEDRITLMNYFKKNVTLQDEAMELEIGKFESYN